MFGQKSENGARDLHVRTFQGVQFGVPYTKHYCPAACGSVFPFMNPHTREHITYSCWLPIMMRNPVAAQDYNTDMSGLWFGHNLHGYNSLLTGSRLSRARQLHYNDWPCASDSLFQALWLSHPAPYLVNTQSWFCYLHPDNPCTNTCSPPTLTCQQPHLIFLPLQPSVFCFVFLFVFMYINYSWIIQAFPFLDQYKCNSLGCPKSACLQAFVHITAIDSFWFGLVPTLSVQQNTSSRSSKKMELVCIPSISHDTTS